MNYYFMIFNKDDEFLFSEYTLHDAKAATELIGNGSYFLEHDL